MVRELYHADSLTKICGKDDKVNSKSRCCMSRHTVLLIALLAPAQLLILVTLTTESTKPTESNITIGTKRTSIQKNESTAFHNNSNYCTFTRDNLICFVFCTDINVSGVSPGDIIAQEIKNANKTCSSNSFFNLIIRDSNFPNKSLTPEWFSEGHSLKIRTLGILYCQLDFIYENSFRGTEFNELEHLTLEGLQLRELKRNTFKGLSNVQTLSLKQMNDLVSVEDGILNELNSLTSLTFEDMNKSLPYYKNLTGNNNFLPQLQQIYYRNNSIPIIESDFFSAVTTAVHIFLRNSSIKTIKPHAFSFPALSLRSLYLEQNLISTLEEASLDLPSMSYDGYKIYLKDNPLICNCKLAWIERFKSHLDDPTCKEPSLPLNNIDFNFCNFSSTTTEAVDVTSTHTTITRSTEISIPSTYSITSQSTEAPTYTTKENTYNPPTTLIQSTETFPTTQTDFSTLEVTDPSLTVSSTSSATQYLPTTTTVLPPVSIDVCKERNNEDFSQLPLNDTPYFLPPDEEFSLQEIENKEGVVHINIGENSWGGTLVWQSNKNSSNSSKNLTCDKWSNLKGAVTISELEPKGSYSFCILSPKSLQASPFNCIGHTMMPNFEERVWLPQKWFYPAIAILVSVILSAIIIVAVIVFMTIKCHPKLIGKNVIIVKQRAESILVLPHKYVKERKETSQIHKPSQVIGQYGTVTQVNQPDTTNKNAHETTPRSSCSSSSASYITLTDPTFMQIMEWRIEKLRKWIQKRFQIRDSERTLSTSKLMRRTSQSLGENYRKYTETGTSKLMRKTSQPFEETENTVLVETLNVPTISMLVDTSDTSTD